MLPKVRFEKMNIEDNLDILVYYSKMENSEDVPFNFYNFTLKLFPSLNGKLKNNMSDEEVYMILEKEVKPILENLYDNSNDTLIYQNVWDDVNDNIMKDLEERLDTKWDISKVICNIGMFPVLSRDIMEGTYEINYGSDRDSIIETGIHELCHILYFKKWREIYPNYKEEEFDKPHIAWYLSEAMIDPLLNNDIFRKYTSTSLVSYSVFYEIFVDGRSIIEILREYVNKYGVEEAIKKGYELFIKYEKEIRKYESN